MFFNEFDALDIRLNELWNTVDYFILVESPHTHKGNPKRLYFNEQKARYAPFMSKIRHIIIDLPEFTGNPWILENAHRRGIMKGLDDISARDYLIITDADEIPSAEAIKQATGDVVLLSMYFFYYKFNYRNQYPWDIVKMVRWEAMLEDINYYRQHVPVDQIIRNAGWHFSKCYDVENMKMLFKELADGLDSIVERLPELSQKGITDWCGHQNKFDKVPIDETFPDYLIKNQSKFKDLIEP